MLQTSTRIGPLQIGVIVLTVATAIIHLQLNFPDPMFILNGLGYLALLIALYLQLPLPMALSRAQIRWALIAFTAVTVLGWLAIGARTPIGFVDKAIEVVLIVLLLVEARQT